MLKKRCAVIGASPDTEIDIIKKNIKKDDFVVCADGGYVFALKAGVTPNMIIGDFDSSVFPKNICCEIISLPTMKDDTDTNFCVKECVRRGYNDFIFLGMTGGRLDHTFANFCTMRFLANRNISMLMVDSENCAFVMNEGMKEISGKKGAKFSIFPFGCDRCKITLKGFLYELENGELTADFPLGVSNTVCSDKALITVYKGSVIVMIQENIR